MKDKYTIFELLCLYVAIALVVLAVLLVAKEVRSEEVPTYKECYQYINRYIKSVNSFMVLKVDINDTTIDYGVLFECKKGHPFVVMNMHGDEDLVYILCTEDPDKEITE